MLNHNEHALSRFVSYLSIKENERVNKLLVEPLVKSFFESRGLYNYKPIAANAAISDLDFKKEKIDFSYFYSHVFNDITKNKGKPELTVKYCITLDQKNCSQKCEKTNIFYDEISLNKQPVFYFIYLDINEIFGFLREQKLPETNFRN